MKKSVIIIASIGICFILVSLVFVILTNIISPTDSNKKNKSVESMEEKALKVITSRTNEDSKNYVFQEKDSDGHYVFKSSDGAIYTVDLENDNYIISESHSFKGAGED